MIVHWPKGIPRGNTNRILSQFGYLPDLVETCLEVARAKRPQKKNGKTVPVGDGISFVKALQGSKAPLHTNPIFIEHEGNRIAREGKWKLVSYANKPWELFDMEADRSEINDLAAQRTSIVKHLNNAYAKWAKRVGVVDWKVARNYSVYKAKKKKTPPKQK